MNILIHCFSSLFFTPFSYVEKGVIYFMGEAILTRDFGRGNSSWSSGLYTYYTELIEASQTWVVPEVYNKQFSIRIFGGGGGVSFGSCGGGGGGRYMNNGVFTLEKRQHDIYNHRIWRRCNSRKWL